MLLTDYQNIISKQFDDQGQQFIDACKSAKLKIGFTNGCFDVLHVGHVANLNFCKSKCDILIVGLNSDLSVKKLKGEERPVHAFEARASVLCGLRAVDYVIGFESETPLELIRIVQPKKLFKGGDYRAEDIVGYQDVINNGGKVEVFPTITGYSTSSILDKGKK